MAIFLRELRKNRKSFIIWSAILIVCNIGMLAMYPAMAADAESLAEIMKAYPKEMLDALSLDKLNLAHIMDFFAYVFVYIVLFAGVYAMILGAGILSKEESDKTVEFLLAKPVTRNGVISAKLLAVLFYLVLMNLLFAAADFAAFEAFKKEAYDFGVFVLVHTGMFLIQLTFAALGFLISIFAVKAKTVMPISFGVVLGAFFLSIASAVSKDLDFFKHLTPFKYFEPAMIAVNGRIDAVYVLVVLLFSVLCISLSYLLYNRKDISV